uniref:Uncharacterized protein n=1 Tax=Arundo donax TaxID=35708 RepID=A0A0A9G4P0_ARUDO
MVQLHDRHHPLERLLQDTFPVGVVAPGRRQLQVLADEERLRPVGHRAGHWPQVDAAGAGAGPDRHHHKQHRHQRPQRQRHLRKLAEDRPVHWYSVPSPLLSAGCASCSS